MLCVGGVLRDATVPPHHCGLLMSTGGTCREGPHPPASAEPLSSQMGAAAWLPSAFTEAPLQLPVGTTHLPPPRQPAVLGGLRLVLTQLRAIPELWETAGVCKQWLLYKRLAESVDPAGGG